jgi:hypothetical protein
MSASLEPSHFGVDGKPAAGQIGRSDQTAVRPIGPVEHVNFGVEGGIWDQASSRKLLRAGDENLAIPLLFPEPQSAFDAVRLEAVSKPDSRFRSEADMCRGVAEEGGRPGRGGLSSCSSVHGAILTETTSRRVKH